MLGRRVAVLLTMALAVSMTSGRALAASDDDASVVVQDAAPAGESGPRPEVRLGRERPGGTPLVILTGAGLLGHWSLPLRCGGGAWTLIRTSLEGDAQDAVAVFRVPPEATEGVLRQPQCRLHVLDGVVTVTAEAASAAWALPSGPRTAGLTGRVLWVVDGQTIGVQIGNRVETVRYAGVSVHEGPADRAPAPGEPSGTMLNRSLVGDRVVRLELDQEERDVFGRLLAYVHVEDTMINAELVRRGYAEATMAGLNLRHRTTLAKLEADAKREARGLWARPDAPAGPQRTAQPLDEKGLTCPSTHPIKARTLPNGSKRFYPEASRWGVRASAEACYGTEMEAMVDGYNRSPR